MLQKLKHHVTNINKLPRTSIIRPGVAITIWKRRNVSGEFLRPITARANRAMNQSKIAAIPRSLLKAREKSRVQVTVGFGFPSHWLINWRDIFKPITTRSNCKSRDYFWQSLENCPIHAVEDVFRVSIASSKHEGELGEFETIVQTREAVEGLHNCQEFSQLSECLDKAM